ncbi:unnamed protein product [Ectocarpus sp. 12 AP-2014]
MSVAIVPMGNVYDYSDTTKGLVCSLEADIKPLTSWSTPTSWFDVGFFQC